MCTKHMEDWNKEWSLTIVIVVFSWYPEDPNEEEIQKMALTMKDAKVGENIP